jgi:hypothetical protein
MASIPDGTAVGGNARGDNSVDLQISRTLNTQVASGEYSFIGSGKNNRNLAPNSIIVGGVSNYINGSVGSSYQNKVIVGGDSNQISNIATRNTFIGGGYGNNINGGTEGGLIVGGYQNTLSGDKSVISGGQSNTISSGYSTISGGQSNTASTGTHATVIGGSTNTSSGQYSVSGGYNNTSSGVASVVFGESNTASGNHSFAGGFGINTASSLASFAYGYKNTASVGIGATAIGMYNQASAQGAIALGGIGGGVGNRATAIASLALGGSTSTYLVGQLGLSYSYFNSFGDAQQSLLTARKADTLTTAATSSLSLDGTGTTNLIIVNGTNRTWNTTVNWVATVTGSSGTTTGVTVGDSIYGVSEFGFKVSASIASITPLIRDSIVADTTIMETCTMTYTTGSTAKELRLTLTAPTFAGSGSLGMRVVAKVSLVELAW